MKHPWSRRYAYNGRRYRSATDVTLGLELPAPGAPEPLSNYIAVGDDCGCKRKGGLGDISLGSPLVLAGVGAAVYFLFFRKR